MRCLLNEYSLAFAFAVEEERLLCTLFEALQCITIAPGLTYLLKS